MVVVKSEVRAEIIHVARKIFTRYGFKKTTMEEIAAASRKGKSSIYYYPFQLYRCKESKVEHTMEDRLYEMGINVHQSK